MLFATLEPLHLERQSANLGDPYLCLLDPLPRPYDGTCRLHTPTPSPQIGPFACMRYRSCLRQVPLRAPCAGQSSSRSVAVRNAQSTTKARNHLPCPYTTGSHICRMPQSLAHLRIQGVRKGPIAFLERLLRLGRIAIAADDDGIEAHGIVEQVGHQPPGHVGLVDVER